MKFNNFDELKQEIENAINTLKGEIKDLGFPDRAKLEAYVKEAVQPVLNTLHDLEVVQGLLAKINSMPVLDPIAIKDNKNAKKLKDNLSELRTTLLTEYSKLQTNLHDSLNASTMKMKDMRQLIHEAEKNYGKDYSEIKQRADEIRRNYRSNLDGIFTELRVNKELFHDGRDLHEDEKLQHSQKAEMVDKVFDEKVSQIDQFELAVKRLETTLRTAPKKDEQVKIATAQTKVIKKEVSPRTVVVTRDGLEKLRHSTHLTIDLNVMQELLEAQEIKTLANPTPDDEKAQKKYNEINLQLAEIENLIASALTEEEVKADDLLQTVGPNYSQIQYGAEAVKSYNDVLNSDKDREAEINSLEEYKKSVLELGKADASAIEEGVTAEQRVDRQFENYRSYGSEVTRMNQMIDDLRNADSKTIPAEYLKAKEKLESLSYYNRYTNALSSELDELTHGGR